MSYNTSYPVEVKFLLMADEFVHNSVFEVVVMVCSPPSLGSLLHGYNLVIH